MSGRADLNTAMGVASGCPKRSLFEGVGGVETSNDR